MRGFFLVTWLSWNCPGGWFSGLVPEAARPLACTPVVKKEAYDRLSMARKRISELGPSSKADLTLVQGLRLTDRPVSWVTTVKF